VKVKGIPSYIYQDKKKRENPARMAQKETRTRKNVPFPSSQMALLFSSVFDLYLSTLLTNV
jgi:hypothetical protein